MATEAQTCAIGILANRPNAQESGSPRTNHLSSPICQPIITLIMQNEPNFRKSQVNVNLYNTIDYENKSDWTLGKNKPNSKPIQTQTKPIAERVKLMQCVYLQRIMKKNADMGP
jgi:hypothetical protein